jgi:protein phosphatase 1L
MLTWNLFHARITSTHAILLLFLLHFFVFLVTQVVSENLVEYSTCDMGYLNSVLSSSSQVNSADDSPVSGGGLRFVNLNLCLDL